MRNVAATRKKREIVRKKKDATCLNTAQRHRSFTLAAPLASSNYEIARSSFVVDITDLSILTNFNISKVAVATLASDPSLLLTLLGQNQRFSYLCYVPQYYGHSDCLTAATDSVLCKLQSLLRPNAAATENDLKRYDRALTSLQQAVDNPEACTGVDVLCSAQLLNIRELMEMSSTRVWDNHMQGSIVLAKHRTPTSFNSDFDRCLLMAQAGPVVFESLVKNKPCYLAEPAWTAAYQSSIVETAHLTDRSALTVNLRCIMFRIPGLWHYVGRVIESDQLFDDCALESAEMEARLICQDLLAWMSEFRRYCQVNPVERATPDVCDMRCELTGIYNECLVVVKRLMAAVCDEQRVELEQGVQTLAEQIVFMQKTPMPHYSWLFCGHETGVARTIQLTRHEWEVDERYDCSYDRRMAMRARYMSWSRYAKEGYY